MKLTEKTIERATIPEGQTRLLLWDEEPPGFGVMIGRKKIAFLVNYRADGSERRQTIGHRGGPCPDGGTWNLERARRRAREILGMVAAGQDPSAPERANREGPALAEACAIYVKRLRAKGSRPSAIRTVVCEIGDPETSYLAKWLPRPITSITGKECRERHEQITRDNGTHIANRVLRELRAIWNHLSREIAVGVIDGMPRGMILPQSPTIAVEWNTENDTSGHVERRRQPIAWKDLPAWHAAVLAIESHVRRDYNLLVLLTGIRRRDAATIRWQHVNTSDEAIDTTVWNAAKKAWDPISLPARAMLRPSPKGGSKRAFTVPLSDALIALLDARRAENAAIHRDDRGWVFPATAIKSDSKRKQPCEECPALGMPPHERGAVVHLSEPKEDFAALVSPHRLRDTYTTALAEINDPPISPFVIDMLTNHRPPRGSVTAGYIGYLSVLAECQERVSRFLVARFTPVRPPVRLRSVA